MEEKKEIENEVLKKKENNKKVLFGGIRNIIAGEINTLILCSLMSVLSLGVYRISYLRFYQDEKTLDLQYSYFISIAFTITLTICNLFAPTLQNKIGLRGVIICGLIINLISNLILFFSKQYFIDLISYFIFGSGFMATVLMGRNMMYFFFEIRGKLIGTLSIVRALLSMGFGYISELIVVNPESDEADVDGRFYTLNISERVLNYIIINIIITIICYILILIIIVPYDKKKHGKGISFYNKQIISKNDSNDSNKDEIVKEINNENLISINDEEENEKEEIVKNEDEEKDKNEDEIKDKNDEEENQKLKNIKKKKQFFAKIFIKKIFKSRRIIFLILMSFFSTPIGTFFNSQWRNIAIRNKIPTSYQQFIVVINSIISCFSTLVFSWLSDSIPFRYLYSVLGFILSFIGVIYCFTFKSPLLFTIIVLVHTLANSGKLAVGLPHFMKVFGLKYYIEISTIIRIPSAILNPLCNVFMFIFDNKYKDNLSEDNDTKVSNGPYFILYTIISLLNGISAFLSCFETEDVLKL